MHTHACCGTHLGVQRLGGNNVSPGLLALLWQHVGNPGVHADWTALRDEQPYEAFALIPEPLACTWLQENPQDLPEEEGSLVWMRYMRFVRRTDTIPASRKLFMRARKWPRCSWQARAAPALRRLAASSRLLGRAALAQIELWIRHNRRPAPVSSRRAPASSPARHPAWVSCTVLHRSDFSCQPLLLPAEGPLCSMLYLAWATTARLERSKSPAPAQVFMHSAMMEWHTDRQTPVPRNILELCMKSAHIRQPSFVRAYARFLAQTGDVSNARAVFERALAQPEAPLGIWDAYLEVGPGFRV